MLTFEFIGRFILLGKQDVKCFGDEVQTIGPLDRYLEKD